MSEELPSVVIVDDHALFRAGVRAELEGMAEVRAEAGAVSEAVAAILAEQPDVVLVDVHMPDGGGAEVIRRVIRERPGQRFLALSVSDAAEDVIATIRAGARGYVTKSISGEELAAAIRRVRDGDAVFSPRAGRIRPRCLPGGDTGGRDRSGARPAHPARARGPPPDRPWLPLQGDRPPARDLTANRRGSRQRRAAQAAALQPPRAEPLGRRPPPGRVTWDLSAPYRRFKGPTPRTPPIPEDVGPLSCHIGASRSHLRCGGEGWSARAGGTRVISTRSATSIASSAPWAASM